MKAAGAEAAGVAGSGLWEEVVSMISTFGAESQDGGKLLGENDRKWDVY